MPKEERNKNSKKSESEEKANALDNDKSYRRYLRNINNLVGQASLNLYGTDRTSDVDNLNNVFQKLLNEQIGDITNRSNEDITSFLGKVISNDNKNNVANDILSRQFMSMTDTDYSSMQSIIYDAYRNRLVEQSDLHEVSSQLIELSEAILITRDAIVSADVVEGRMSRNLNFENLDDDDLEDAVAVIHRMEKKFSLLEKIKNFIIPKTLEYGEYYAYVIPYSKLFEDLQKQKEMQYGYRHYTESTVLDGFFESSSDDHKKQKKNEKSSELDRFLESCYEKFTVQNETRYTKYEFEKEIHESENIPKNEFKKDLKNIMNNIVICNDPVPLPVLEEGIDSIMYLKKYNEKVMNEASKDDDMFTRVANANIASNGIIIDKSKKSRKDKNDFSDIGDCYLRMMDPTRIVPIQIVNTTIGYVYVQDEDITPLHGAVSSNLYYTKFDEHSKQATIIDAIAERVVRQFDKPFLKNNIKFKEAIVDCFNYYNLNEKRVKFQFIPAEYIVAFKIDEDVEGNGTSMIKKSLFYAKLYLMLLLFKIMSIILNSNDQKINYVKQSGIDKNVANKVQEIIRMHQSRQINISDLFSYTTLINKVGSGNSMYVPVGRSGERPVETDILSGQEVQLNTELMENLKNSYILATGVPAAIVNYMNEADFAKVVEQNNTKFNGRVVNYQLDFNSGITELYKKIMLWSTNLNENVISNFTFSLQPPKATAINTKSELINQFQGLVDFLVNLEYPDPNGSNVMNPDDLNAEIREFKKLFARDQLPMIDFDRINKLMTDAKINFQEKKLRPDPSNGDNGDDDGLDGELDNMDI